MKTALRTATVAWLNQWAFTPQLYGVGLALLLTLFLEETGPAVRRAAS